MINDAWINYIIIIAQLHIPKVV